MNGNKRIVIAREHIPARAPFAETMILLFLWEIRDPAMWLTVSIAILGLAWWAVFAYCYFKEREVFINPLEVGGEDEDAE